MGQQAVPLAQDATQALGFLLAAAEGAADWIMTLASGRSMAKLPTWRQSGSGIRPHGTGGRVAPPRTAVLPVMMEIITVSHLLSLQVHADDQHLVVGVFGQELVQHIKLDRVLGGDAIFYRLGQA